MIRRRMARSACALTLGLAIATPALAQSFGQQVGQQFKDAALTTTVAARLQYNRALLMEKIDIAAENGVVTLSGKVSNQNAINTAVKIASETKGVKQVVNQMTIGRRDPDQAVITPP